MQVGPIFNGCFHFYSFVGYSWDKTPGWYKKMWDRWTEVIYETKMPYGYTLGNHDGEADLTRREVVEVDVKMNLWFFDSNRNNCLNVEGWGCVDHSAVNWYRTKSIELESVQNGRKPGVAFMHIPPPEFIFAYEVETWIVF